MRLPGTEPKPNASTNESTAPVTEAPAKSAITIDPIAIIFLILSWWKFLLFCVVVFTGLAYVYAKSAPYIYRAAARIEVFQENRLRDDGRLNEYDKLESEVNRHIIIMSGEIFHKDLIKKLQPEWGSQLTEDEMEVPFKISGLSKSKSMIELTVDSTNPEYALEYLQGIIGSYHRLRQREFTQINENALSGLRNEEAIIQAKLTKVKQEIEAFEIANQVLIAQEREQKQGELVNDLLGRLQSIQVERSILENQYQDIVNADLPTIRATFADNQNMHVRELLLDFGSLETGRQVDQAITASLIGFDSEPQRAMSWEQQEDLLATLQSEYERRLEVFRPTHPEMQKLRKQMEILQVSLDKKLEIAFRRFQAHYQALKRKEESIEKVVADLEGKSNLSAEKKNAYLLLKSREDQLQRKYDLIYQRLLANAGSIDNLSLITIQEPYVLEEPIAPNKIKLLAVGPILGMAFGVFIVLLKGLVIPFIMEFLKQHRGATKRHPAVILSSHSS